MIIFSDKDANFARLCLAQDSQQSRATWHFMTFASF